MASLHLFFLVSLLLLTLMPHLSLSQSSQISLPPSFPPTSTFSSSDPADLASPPDLSVSDSPSSSPFASPPSTSDLLDEAPAPSPLSSPVKPFPVPAPTPSYAAAVKASSIDAGEEETKTDEKKGLDGHKKAGVVVGVFAATAVVGLGVLVCKKRQANIRRSRYGYSSSSRVEMV
ncbi:hypothetical protein FCM35_KLT19667 [Carex littledalei]|uniref:Uncharacterized protein n=1 Tax=Carex littledalei TaxID=544730 RepID=A0A833VNY0_9POAL|nr:hypothetical protein FCM35_KLT19667 [Carex littledalei]